MKYIFVVAPVFTAKSSVSRATLATISSQCPATSQEPTFAVNCLNAESLQLATLPSTPRIPRNLGYLLTSSGDHLTNMNFDDCIYPQTWTAVTYWRITLVGDRDVAY